MSQTPSFLFLVTLLLFSFFFLVLQVHADDELLSADEEDKHDSGRTYHFKKKHHGGMGSKLHKQLHHPAAGGGEGSPYPDDLTTPHLWHQEILTEARYGALVHVLFVYSHSENSKLARKSWHHVEEALKNIVQLMQVDATEGTVFEQNVAGAFAEGPLPALLIFQDAGQLRPKLLSSKFTTAEEWIEIVRHRVQRLEKAGGEGKGGGPLSVRVKRGAHFSAPEQKEKEDSIGKQRPSSSVGLDEADSINVDEL